MPIELGSRANFGTKKLLNCNSFRIQLNNNGVKFCSVLPVIHKSSTSPKMQDFKQIINTINVRRQILIAHLQVVAKILLTHKKLLHMLPP